MNFDKFREKKEIKLNDIINSSKEYINEIQEDLNEIKENVLKLDKNNKYEIIEMNVKSTNKDCLYEEPILIINNKKSHHIEYGWQYYYTYFLIYNNTIWKIENNVFNSSKIDNITHFKDLNYEIGHYNKFDKRHIISKKLMYEYILYNQETDDFKTAIEVVNRINKDKKRNSKKNIFKTMYDSYLKFLKDTDMGVVVSIWMLLIFSSVVMVGIMITFAAILS